MTHRPSRVWFRSVLALILLPMVCGTAVGQSSYSWTTGTSNPWGGAFWTRNSGSGPVNGPPGAADSATVSVGGTYTVSVTDARTVNTVTLGSGSATLLTGTAGGGSLTVNGAFALNSGNLDNTNGGLVLNGSFNWGGGTVSGGTVTAGSGGAITGGGIVNGSSSELRLSNGTWTWSGGNIAPNNNGKLRIDAGATLQLTNNVSFGSTVGGGVVENAGLITKTAGTGSSWIGNLVTLNNTGTLRVTTGSWNVQGGILNNAGVIDLGSGTYMSVHSGGTLVLNAGASITGGGPLSMTDGSATITVNGNVTSAGGLQMTRGQLNGAGTLTLNGGFDLGFFDPNSVTGLTVNANAGGNWTGTDTPRIGTGTVNITGGTVTWNTSPISFVENGSLTVGANGTLNLTGDENVSVNAGFNPTFTVDGLFKKSGGTSNAAVSSLANLSVGSTGTIDVQSGNLYLHPAAITNNGVIKASTGHLFFNNNSGGNATTTLTGTGTLQTDLGSTLNVAPGGGRSVVLASGTLTHLGTLNLTSGTFKVAAAATITNYNPGTTTLTGGIWKVSNATLDLDGRGITNIASGTTVELTGGSASVTGLSQLTQLTGHLRVLNGATFTPLSTVSNGGTVDASGMFGGSMTVTNTGVLTGSGSVNGPVTVQSGGVVTPGPYQSTGVAVLQTGTLTLNGGSLYVWELNSWAANATAGNTGNGFDQVRGGVSGAKLNLNGATAADRIVIKITSLNGSTAGQIASYDPAVAREWVIADYDFGNATGGVIGFSADKFTLDTSAFANDSNSTRFSLRTDANSNHLILAFTPVPEPTVPLVAAAGVAGLIGWFRRRRAR